MIPTSRRGFLIGIGAILAAPAIVRVASLMPIKAPPLVFAETWQHRVFALGYYGASFSAYGRMAPALLGGIELGHWTALRALANS